MARNGPSRWKGQNLADLKAAYEGDQEQVEEIAARFKTSRGNLSRLAVLHGWRRRGPGRLPPEAHAHWNLYRKVQEIAGREAALQAVRQ